MAEASLTPAVAACLLAAMCPARNCIPSAAYCRTLQDHLGTYLMLSFLCTLSSASLLLCYLCSLKAVFQPTQSNTLQLHFCMARIRVKMRILNGATDEHTNKLHAGQLPINPTCEACISTRNSQKTPKHTHPSACRLSQRQFPSAQSTAAHQTCS